MKTEASTFGTSTCHRLLMGLLLLASGGLQCAVGEPVAMVTDLSGSVTMNGERLEILAELEAGSRVSAAESSTINLFYFGSGMAFRFSGPAEFLIGDAEPEVISGESPEKGSVLPEKSGSMSTIGLAQVAVVMRAGPNEPKLNLVSPVDSKLLQPPQVFEWAPLSEGVGYSFELTDSEGRSLIETLVTGTRLAVPSHILLAAGEYYTWTIETRLPDGRKFSNWASFSIAQPSLREEVESLRPGEDASVSQLVVYALWLEQQELLDEARRYWAQVRELRPESSRVADRVGDSP